MTPPASPSSPQPFSGAAPIEALLAHREWVRGLARSLVRDESSVDDVEQQTWQAALENPPRKAGSLRAWLGSVVRRTVLDSQRRHVRRERREAAVARPEGIAATSDVVARVEIDRAVVNSVAELPEPYRTTLLLRFYDGLPPREIAKRMDAPVETVRARVRRGLERVRAGLDARHGGERGVWKSALVPFLAGPGGAAPDASGSTATAGGSGASLAVTLVAAAGALVAGVLGGAVVRSNAGAGAPAGGDAPQAAALIDAERALVADRGALTQLEGRLSESRAAAVELEEQLDDVRRATVAMTEPTSGHPTADAGPRTPFMRPFRFPDYEGVLAEVDWDELGEHIARMIPLLDEIYSSRRDGEPLRPEAVGSLQAHNGVVVAVLGALDEAFPSMSVNAAITHPAFSATMAAAVCHARDLPLSAEQLTALDRAAQDASRAVSRAVDRAATREFALEAMLDECRAKMEFEAALHALLTPEQQALFRHDATRNVVGYDLFGPAQMWAEVVETGMFPAGMDVSAVIARGMTRELELDAEQTVALKAAVQTWFDALPEEYLAQPPSGFGDLKSAHRVDDVLVAAGHMLDLMRHVIEVDLSREQREWVRSSKQVLFLRRLP